VGVPKCPVKAQIWGAACGLACALGAGPALAQAPHVDNRCPRLANDAYEELDARVLLLLRGEHGKRPPPAIVCKASSAWVEWEGRRFEVTGRSTIVDEAVDIIEAQLHEDERAADADPKTAEAAAIASGQPVLERGTGSAPPTPPVRQPANRVAVRPSDARGGGIALGIETELPSASIATAVGPAFDFAASVGPVLVGAREAIRFSVAGRRVSFMDFQAALSYGAPFDPAAHVGGVVRFGAEWIVEYPEGNSGQAAVVPVTDLGLRLANSFGLVGLWLGVDAHFRLSPLLLRSRGALRANDVGGSFTLGVDFVDWSRK
jgi:hypothetical protein